MDPKVKKATGEGMTLVGGYMMGMALNAIRDTTTPAVFADRARRMYGISVEEAEQLIGAFARIVPLIEEIRPIVAKGDKRLDAKIRGF
jgi:hypothetical protein